MDFEHINTESNIVSKEDLLQHYSDLQVSEVQNRITQHILIEKRKKKQIQESNLILTCLKNHFIFYNLSEAEIQNVKDHMYFTKVKQDEIIYNYKDIGTCFFIVQKGELQLIGEDNAKTKILKPNDGFGQLALLYKTARNSQVTALVDSQLWVIDRVTFRQAVEEMIIREYTQNKKCFESVRFFSNLTPDQKDIIASSLIRQKFYKGQIIIQEGDPGSTFYYIKEGSASVYKASKFQRKLAKGDSFGEQSLYYNTMRQYTIKADEDVICLVLGRDTLNRIMADNIYEVTFKNFIRWAFEKDPTMSRLTKEIQQKIIDQMKISSYKAQESIFKRGMVGFQKLVVVIEGNLKKVKKGNIVASKGQCFGQYYLLNPTQVLDDEIVMHNYGVIAEISDAAFNDAINNMKIEDLFNQKKQENQLILQSMQIKNHEREMLKDAKPEDLRITYLLSSKGQFGPLYTVKYQDKQFILKIIDKEQLVKYEVEQFAIDEGEVLQNVSSPFVLSLGRKFQSANYVYYLSQYVKGGDLYEILKNIGLLSTQDSQFYTASIILILEYFAQKGIICRDIKPENFMVDQKGYLKLINLPTAKMISKDSQGNFKKTYTIIGTPHYMAPDIVIGKGYNNMVDLWSLGVCLYEFLCGVLPFGDSSESAYEIYEQIMQTELKFPQFLHDKKAKKLIEQLLSHNPAQRHGGSFQNLKKHSWFENFRWKALLERNKHDLQPPAFPSISDKYEKKVDIRLPELVRTLQKHKRNDKVSPRWAEFSEIIE